MEQGREAENVYAENEILYFDEVFRAMSVVVSF